ncbi:MAG TPA: acyl-CoA thioesterase [Woeseiaceae bacterium]|nr:acyl-CoA thioesterase [Woeseiaceae bacterium]
MSMPGRAPSHSAVEQNVYKVFPNDLNAQQTVFGGLVMALCDRTALIVAERHSGTTCVTAAVDSLNFLSPARTGETLVVKAAVNRAWNTSMEIGVRVVAENSRSGEIRHVVSAYLTFVGLDETGAPTSVPDVVPESDDEKRRYRSAQVRRDARLRTRDSLRTI